MRSVTLATFNDRDHAEPVLQRLQQAGFEATIHDETKWQRHRMAERLASVKVQIDEVEYDRARQQLRDWDASEHILEQAVCCPECGSPDVDFPQVTRKFILPSLHALFYRLGLEEKLFYCNTCHATWPLREKVESERDPLGWPIKGKPLHHNPDVTP
jgi:hypothetical protein